MLPRLKHNNPGALADLGVGLWAWPLPIDYNKDGLMDLVVESAAPEHGIRRGWFGREQAPAGVALTFETELGYTFDPAVWGQGFATEAARCVRDYARDVLRLPYTVSAILPQNARSRRVAERSGARAAGQMEVVGLTWDRYVWPLATSGAHSSGT